MLSLSYLFLGAYGRHRWKVVVALWPLAVACVFAGVQFWLVRIGVLDAQKTLGVAAFYLLGYLLVYLLVRSGWGLQVIGNSVLVSVQVVVGVVAVAWTYAISGPLRGVLVGVLVLILIYSMFMLASLQVALLALFAGLVMGATIAWKSRTDPAHYSATVGIVEFSMLAVMLLAVAALAVRMQALRDHYRRQKKALAAASAQLSLLATQDDLTQLPNRRHMNVLMKSEVIRQKRSGQSMSLAMLDIDHFKLVNDTLGHNGGDAVLKMFTQAVSQTLRGSDVLSRWGGEEFLLMMPNTSVKEAVRGVERMRAALAQYSFNDISPGLHVTFSAGVTSVAGDEALFSAIERADQAMHRAKGNGRDCTEQD